MKRWLINKGYTLSVWVNRELWTGNNRPLCAEYYAKFLHATGWRETAWVWWVVFIDFLFTHLESNHCSRSWRRSTPQGYTQ